MSWNFIHAARRSLATANTRDPPGRLCRRGGRLCMRCRWGTFCSQVTKRGAAAPGGRAGSAAAGDPGDAGLPGPGQGGGDKRSPEQEPGVPEVGVSGQRPGIGTGRRRDRSGLRQQPRDGQHQAIDRQDRGLEPCQHPRPALHGVGCLPGCHPSRRQRHDGADDLQRGGGAYGQDDARVTGAALLFQRACDSPACLRQYRSARSRPVPSTR